MTVQAGQPALANAKIRFSSCKYIKRWRGFSLYVAVFQAFSQLP